MKKYTRAICALFMLFLLYSCGINNPYDNSTPEKFIYSLGQIGLQPKEQNPIPFFYMEKDANSITEYDETAIKCLSAFQTFKTVLSEKFPTKIKTVDEKEIVLNVDPSSFSSLSFRFSVSIIKEQLQASAPDDYEFVSAIEEGVDGITKITYKMKGKESDLNVKFENEQYVMFLPEGSLVQLKKMVPFFVQNEALLSSFLKEIEDNELSLDNFDTKVKDWNFKYQETLSLLN